MVGGEKVLAGDTGNSADVLGRKRGVESLWNIFPSEQLSWVFVGSGNVD